MVKLPTESYPLDGTLHLPSLLKIVPANKLSAIDRQPIAPAGACYWNVDEVVRRSGGSLAYGWMITWLPDTLITAMHHAVYVTPDGTMIDITDVDPGGGLPSRGTTTFVVDNQYGMDRVRPVPIPQRLISLTVDPAVERMIAAYKRNASINHEMVLEVIRAGWSWSLMAGWQPPPGLQPPPHLIQRNAELHTSHQQYHRLRKEVLANYQRRRAIRKPGIQSRGPRP